MFTFFFNIFLYFQKNLFWKSLKARQVLIPVRPVVYCTDIRVNTLIDTFDNISLVELRYQQIERHLQIKRGMCNNKNLIFRKGKHLVSCQFFLNIRTGSEYLYFLVSLSIHDPICMYLFIFACCPYQFTHLKMLLTTNPNKAHQLSWVINIYCCFIITPKPCLSFEGCCLVIIIALPHFVLCGGLPSYRHSCLM